ncbi:MAG: hypothetical protein QOF78_51 [Phycisphaerales bacterium]|jgi:hypothetical protein|nr:hypothetical protein [Phycisphaerales bacterium]
MTTILDLSSELLIDRSKIRDPYLRLLLTAIGEEFVGGSAWVAVNKRVAWQYGLTHEYMAPCSAAAVA